MESYSVEAVLSAVDKNFTSTMNKADSSMGGLDKSSQNTKKSDKSISESSQNSDSTEKPKSKSSNSTSEMTPL